VAAAAATCSCGSTSTCPPGSTKPRRTSCAGSPSCGARMSLRTTTARCSRGSSPPSSKPTGVDAAPVDGPADGSAAAHVWLERLDDGVEVDGDRGHHLARVRRLRVGETVTAADGYGRFRVYVATAVGAGSVTLASRSDVLHETSLAPRLVVAVALT